MGKDEEDDNDDDKDEAKRLEKMLETKPEEPIEMKVVDHKKGGMKKKPLKFI